MIRWGPWRQMWAFQPVPEHPKKCPGVGPSCAGRPGCNRVARLIHSHRGPSTFRVELPVATEGVASDARESR